MSRYGRRQHARWASFRHQQRLEALDRYEAEGHNLARLVYRVVEYKIESTYPKIRGEVWYVLTQLGGHPMPSDATLREALDRVQHAGYVKFNAVTQTYWAALSPTEP